MNEYNDDDFVYVNPKTREVIGLVKWSKDGNPVPLKMDGEEDKEEAKKARIRKKAGKLFYPWGTYRTMKRIHRLEGKQKEGEKNQPFDEALQRAVKETFWDV